MLSSLWMFQIYCSVVVLLLNEFANAAVVGVTQLHLAMHWTIGLT